MGTNRNFESNGMAWTRSPSTRFCRISVTLRTFTSKTGAWERAGIEVQYDLSRERRLEEADIEQLDHSLVVSVAGRYFH